MPTITVNGVDYAYVDEGEGPLILFGHGLLASKNMFDAQIATLSNRYRCVSIDWPGHGDSGYRDSGWSLYDLVDDTVALVQELGEERAIFAGLSQGGMVFLRLALSHPELVAALILLDTSAGPENQQMLPQYQQLASTLVGGTEEDRAHAAAAVELVLYGTTFVREHPQNAARERQVLLSHDRQGSYLAAQAVFARDDVTPQIGAIGAPTLIVVGEEDVATPPSDSATIHEEIAGSEMVIIPECGHHSPIERPDAVTEAIEAFLERLQLPSTD